MEKKNNGFIKSLYQKNIITGYLYFYVHLIVEFICFYSLTWIFGDTFYVWIALLLYDALAFVPQSLIGYLSDKKPKINLGLFGISLLIIGYLLFNFNILNNIYLGIIILALGNAFIHVEGAETTLKSSNGKLSHSAIFVAGGSFGVVLGKILGKYYANPLFIIFLAISTIPFIILARNYRLDKQNDCQKFNYANKKISKSLIIFLATLVVIVRGYIGYGIPTTWNKTLIQTIMLYFTMGIGKALGGILSDAFGIRKVALLSTLLAIPFLIFGDNLMYISLIGILLFSMTMAITLAILVSTLKKTPGLAFGFTTIGLFLGTLPTFFIKINSSIINNSLIVILSIICTFILLFILEKDKKT